MTKHADLEPEVVSRLLDVFIEFVHENVALKNRPPVAWRWYDEANERWEFSVRAEDSPPNAEPLYRGL